MAQMSAQRGQAAEAAEEETFGPLLLTRLEVNTVLRVAAFLSNWKL